MATVQKARSLPIIMPGARRSWPTHLHKNSTSAEAGKLRMVTRQGDMAVEAEATGDSAISGLEARGFFFWVGSRAMAFLHWQAPA